MAPRDTSKAGSTDTPDTGDGDATTSTSATDASTTESAGIDGPTGTVLDGVISTKPPTDPQRVVIEQPPAEPAVFYGDGGLQAPNAPAPVKANYQPFEW